MSDKLKTMVETYKQKTKEFGAPGKKIRLPPSLVDLCIKYILDDNFALLKVDAEKKEKPKSLPQNDQSLGNAFVHSRHNHPPVLQF